MRQSRQPLATVDPDCERFPTDLETIQRRADLQVVPLRRNDRQVLAGLPGLGRLASTTANTTVTCTLWGRAVNVAALEGGDIVFDEHRGLRWIGDTWRHTVAALDREDHGRCPSLMFFSEHGDLIHRVALDGLAHWPDFSSMVAEHQGCARCLMHVPGSALPVEGGRASGPLIRDIWSDAQSLHDLDIRIEKLGLDRLEMVQALDGLYTTPLQLDTFAAVLGRMAGLGLPVHVQVGNAHCIQHLQCTLERVETGPEYWKLFGADVVVRVDPGQLDSVWKAVQPGAAGERHRIECYDLLGKRVLTLSCPPAPCPVVADGWRRLLDACPF